MVVWYEGPGQDHTQNNCLDGGTGLELENGWESDMSDDKRALLTIQQNIHNLERSMSASQLSQVERSLQQHPINIKVKPSCSNLLVFYSGGRSARMHPRSAHMRPQKNPKKV